MAKRKSSGEKGAGSQKEEPGASNTPPGKSWFLGIGINHYQAFDDLHNAVKDIYDFRDTLKDRYGLEPECTMLLINEAVTREQIVDQLDRLVREVEVHDKLIIYFSGHGFLDKLTNRGYWIPHDAHLGRTANYLRNSTIQEYVKDIGALHTLLISDSCFSGSLITRDAADPATAIEEMEKDKSRWVLSSGRQTEKVADGAPGANSPFAASILKLLRDNKQPKLNVAFLADQVIKRTRYNWDQMPQGSPLFGAGHEGGQYVFSLKETMPVASNPEPASIPAPKSIKSSPPETKPLTDGQTGLFTDPRDGQIYKTIRLNGKTWLAQNLNFDVGEGCWWYKNDPSNGEKYGRLYTWEAAKRACPPGWRLPSDEEWRELGVTFGGYRFFTENWINAGDPKKSYKALLTGGNSGFAALLGGYRYPGWIKFYSLGAAGYYWSIKEIGMLSALCYHFTSSDGGYLCRNTNNKSWGFSCRYIQD